MVHIPKQPAPSAPAQRPVPTSADVARLAGVTSRTLRHYDDLGLLAPAYVGGNGYRYYGRAELHRLQRPDEVRTLESLGASSSDKP